MNRRVTAHTKQYLCVYSVGTVADLRGKREGGTVELFKNSEGYAPMLANLAGHFAKDFSSLAQEYQGMLKEAGISPAEWDRRGVADRRNIVAQHDYLNDPKHEAAIYFKLEVFRDVLAEMIAKARADKASDVVVALRDVEDRVKEILDTDRLQAGVEIQAVRQAMLKQVEQNEALADRAYRSPKLPKMNQAAARFWGNADQHDRTTHPSNATVEAWLMEGDYSASLASAAATIIRPDWASTGRRPSEG